MSTAKSKTVKLGDTYMDYVVFGRGDKSLVVIPGLGDGAKTVKGLAIPLAYQYRQWGKHYKVYVFSRKRDLPENYTTHLLADDLARALQQLGVKTADVVGVSQGGATAQYLAINYPQLVNKLVLTVTFAKADNRLIEIINGWIGQINRKKYKEWFIDTAEKTYTDSYLKNLRRFYTVMAKISAPKSNSRFITMANACITHNAQDKLGEIECPVLIIAGGADKLISNKMTQELHSKISHSRLFVYDELCHAVYDEAKDFNSRVLDFLL